MVTVHRDTLLRLGIVNVESANALRFGLDLIDDLPVLVNSRAMFGHKLLFELWEFPPKFENTLFYNTVVRV